MSGMQPNYYLTLGLPPSATQDEIKKRYRELARRYHPDVNPSPEASSKIKSINEAHHVLGDPDRRAIYDAERLLHQTTSKPPPASPPRTERGGASARPSSAQGRARYDYDGFGRATPPRTASSTPGTPRSRPAASRPPVNPTSRPAERKPNLAGTADVLLKEAQLAFINRYYREAEELCRQVLMIDRRNAVAYEVIGDIHVKRGLKESAASAYSYAIQYNPYNYSVQTKLERLLGRRETAHHGLTMTRSVETSAWQEYTTGAKRDTGVAILSVLLLFAFLGMLGLLSIHPGLPFQEIIPWFSSISLNLLIALLFNGFIAGILLALYGGLRPISEELMARGVSAHTRRAPTSVGTLLSLFALIWFYASFMVYIGIAYAQNRVSPSVLRIYGVVMVLSVVFVTLYRPDGAPYSNVQTLAFAGNVLFPVTLLGWRIGDAIRLRRTLR